MKLTQPDAAPAAVETNAELVKPVTTVAKASVQNPLARFTANKLTDPPPGYQFMMNHPKGISQVDVDIIRLTARFTAVNGREFLSGLAQREQRNPQFDFLKPTHMLFSYFTSFVDAYAKIIAPSTDMIKRIIKNTDRMNILEEGVQRWEWNRLEDDRKKKEQSDAEADRSANQSIDWYDFQVVETIDFGENDLLEMVDIAALNPYADRSQARDLSTYTDGMDMVPPPPPPPAEEGDMDIDMEGIRVVSDYTPRIAGNRSKVATMVDPISGKAIPVSDLSEHMRVQLMDPKWREQQQRFLNKQKDTGFAEGASIADSLKNFARQRGDIFSTADEDEAAMLEEHRKKQRRVEVMMGCYNTDALLISYYNFICRKQTKLFGMGISRHWHKCSSRSQIWQQGCRRRCLTCHLAMASDPPLPRLLHRMAQWFRQWECTASLRHRSL